MQIHSCVLLWIVKDVFPDCLQSKPAAVSRVSQPDHVSEDAPDLFSEEAASSTTNKSNGVPSDDDNDLFAGGDTVS